MMPDFYDRTITVSGQPSRSLGDVIAHAVSSWRRDEKISESIFERPATNSSVELARFVCAALELHYASSHPLRQPRRDIIEVINYAMCAHRLDISADKIFVVSPTDNSGWLSGFICEALEQHWDMPLDRVRSHLSLSLVAVTSDSTY